MPEPWFSFFISALFPLALYLAVCLYQKIFPK